MAAEPILPVCSRVLQECMTKVTLSYLSHNHGLVGMSRCILHTACFTFHHALSGEVLLNCTNASNANWVCTRALQQALHSAKLLTPVPCVECRHCGVWDTDLHDICPQVCQGCPSPGHVLPICCVGTARRLLCLSRGQPWHTPSLFLTNHFEAQFELWSPVVVVVCMSAHLLCFLVIAFPRHNPSSCCMLE